MAEFRCDSCGHMRLAPENRIGDRVKCPRCPSTGQVFATPTVRVHNASETLPDSAGDSAAATTFRGWRLPQAEQLLLATAIAAAMLMLCGVLLQFMILQRLNQIGIAPGQRLAVSIEGVLPGVEVPVSLASIPTRSRLPVSIEECSRLIEIPVSIDGVSTTDEINVYLRNHWITSGDPIPVRIEK